MGYYIEARLVRLLMDEVLEKTSTFDLRTVQELFEAVMREQRYFDDMKLPRSILLPEKI